MKVDQTYININDNSDELINSIMTLDLCDGQNPTHIGVRWDFVLLRHIYTNQCLVVQDSWAKEFV